MIGPDFEESMPCDRWKVRVATCNGTKEGLEEILGLKQQSLAPNLPNGVIFNVLQLHRLLHRSR